jgi:hypothetical protein
MKGISAPFKRGLRLALEPLGLELRRRRKPRALSALVRQIIDRAPPADEGAPAWRIELFGPSGVGKTHFATELARQRTPDSGWLVDREAMAAGVVQPLEDRTLARARSDLIPRKQLENLVFNLPESVELRRLSYFLEVLRDDVETARSARDLLILRHDGLFHNFTPELVVQAGAAPDLFTALCRHRIAVFCHAPPDVIADRVAQRGAGGAARPHHAGLDRAGLLQHCATTLAVKSRLVEALEVGGVPLLKVDLSADLQANVEKVSHAIAQHLRNLRPETG